MPFLTLKNYCRFLFIPMLLASCVKEPNTGGNSVVSEYYLMGRLLESSTNPLPLKNYPLEIYQPTESSFLFPNSVNYGFLKLVATDNNGSFKIRHENGNIIFVNDNTRYIEITSKDTLQYKNFSFKWNSISPGKSIDLGNFYLYKEIGFLIRKINFKKELVAGDSLQVFSGEKTKYNSYTKTLYGPIAKNSIVLLDTLYNFRFTEYNFQLSGYSFFSIINGSKIYNDTTISISNQYEKEREVMLIH